MHWPRADRPSDSFPAPTEPAGGGGPAEEAYPTDPDLSADGFAGAAREPGAAFASPFDRAGADESPWANRVVWSAAAAALIFGGVWFAGLWEVHLDAPPAGALAGNETPAEAADEVWSEEEWAPDAATGGDADLAALWGEEPADAAPVAAEENAFDLLADTGEALDEAPFAAPAPTAAASDALAGADPWGEPEPRAAPPVPDRGPDADEPPGGLFAAAAPVRTAEAALAEAAPRVPATPAITPAVPAATPAPTPAPAVEATAAGTPAGSAFDPFGDVAAAPAPAAAPSDPFDAGAAVTPASASSATAAPPAVRTADGAGPIPNAAAPTPPTPPTAAPPIAAQDPSLLAAIDDALEAGEVLQAHTALSRLWWDEPTGRSGLRGRLDGTARQIYFDATSHFMTPRTVAPGETLADVAADLSVPEMYLARVNRVAPAAVAAGDELKVIRGPFGAALDLSGAGAGTLTVHAHGYYVRAFRAQSGDVTPGEYTVAAKVRSPAGVRLLLTGPKGTALTLIGGPAPAGSPAVTLRPADADQVFDLLETNGALSVRP